MAKNMGFITIDRNILRWGWWKNHNTLIVFLYLILSANIKEATFMGVNIERGQLATSHGNIAFATALTINRVRTALDHLKSTGEITIKRYPKFIVITITGYEKYQNPQSKSQSNHDQITIKSQSNHNNQTNKQCKPWKQEKNKGRFAPAPPPGVSYASTMKPIDEGTVEDIPEEYRDFCPTYADYWRYRNR